MNEAYLKRSFMQFYYIVKCGSKNINPSDDGLCILCSDFVGIKYLHTIIFRTDISTNPIQNIFTIYTFLE